MTSALERLHDGGRFRCKTLMLRWWKHLASMGCTRMRRIDWNRQTIRKPNLMYQQVSEHFSEWPDAHDITQFASRKKLRSQRGREGVGWYYFWKNKKKNTVKIVAVCSFREMTSSTYKMKLVRSAKFSWMSSDNVKNAKYALSGSCDCKMTGFVTEVGPSESDRYKLDDSQQADHAWVK